MNRQTTQIIDILTQEFRPACAKFKRPDVWNFVTNKLQEKDVDGESLISKIVLRIKKGKEGDILSIVEESFSTIPLGLQALLLKSIKQTGEKLNCLDTKHSSSEYEAQQMSVVSSGSNTSAGMRLWTEWKSGKIDQSSFFRAINSLTVSGDLCSGSAKMLTELALSEGGYHAGATKRECWGSRLLIETPCLSTHQVALLCVPPASSADINTDLQATLYASNGQFVSLNGADSGVCELQPAKGLPAVSSDSLLWEHVGGPCRNIRLASGSSSDHNNIVLLVGDCIQVPRGVLDVDEVISVDVLSLGRCSEHRNEIQVVLLVEARLLCGSVARAVKDECGDVLWCDGETALPGKDDSSHDSAGSDGEGNHQVIPLSLARKNYFCVFARVLMGLVSVQHVLPVHDSIAHDQVPSRVQYLREHLAVVSGSNGLLGTAVCVTSSVTAAALRANKDEVAGSYTDLEKEDGDNSNDAFQLASRAASGVSSGPLQLRFHLLPVDSLLNKVVPHTVSHEADAAITAVSYCYGDSVLVSGDSAGAACVWAVDVFRGTARLVAPPYQLGSKIRYLQVSPSGSHVAVALWDRLLLLQVTPKARNVPGSVSVRCCLDVLHDVPATYFVFFGQNAGDSLQVWRVTDRATSGASAASGIAVAAWRHENIDHFDQRFGKDSAEVGALLQSTEKQSAKAQRCHAILDRMALTLAEDSLLDDPNRVGNGVCSTVHTDGEEAEGDSCEEHKDSLRFMKVAGEFVPLHKKTFIGANKCRERVSALARPISLRGSECSFNDTNDFVSAKETQAGTSSSNATANTEENTTQPLFAYQVMDAQSTSLCELLRPLRAEQQHANSVKFTKMLSEVFRHDASDRFLRVKSLLAVYCACMQPPSLGLLAAALEVDVGTLSAIVFADLGAFLLVAEENHKSVVQLREECRGLNKWLCANDHTRIGKDYWLEVSFGHNRLCALYLRHCGNKSVAVEHPWQDYLRTYGPSHLRRSSRGLRQLTAHIRKIDETANIKHNLPHQIGYIVGLQEIYARRVGLGGRIPKELGQLSQLRVLSMGNNHLYGELPASLGTLKHLQRIVLHQNNLQGVVPASLGHLGCIVNLAGNPRLLHGEDVPQHEREALEDLFHTTKGPRWSTKTHWCSAQPVAKWYKVGVLTSHVHSIVMSSNGMEGRIPASIASLAHLRMIELATMPGLIGTIPKELCSLTTLRRLCVCRCGLTGKIPSEIGQLVSLEELQLFGNQLSGAIPATIGNLVNLKLLSFGEYTGGNNFAPGPLPSCLASLVNLEALFMANCFLKGPLPSWLGNLRELRQLDLQRNNISGSLPPSIGQLDNLLYLNIKDNEQLGGKLPLPQLMGLTKLNRLSLVHCAFLDAEADVELLKVAMPRCKIWI